MTVVEAMRVSPHDWLSHRPWLVLALWSVLLLLVGISIGQGWRNGDVIGAAVGSYHWQLTHPQTAHQTDNDRPSKVAPGGPN